MRFDCLENNMQKNALSPLDWDAFVKKNGPRSGRFLQSWNWGEFQKQVGLSIYRWSENKDAETIFVAQVIKKSIPYFGSFVYVPRGPIGHVGFVSKLVSHYAQAMFMRCEPMVSLTLIKQAKRAQHVQPSHTLITNLEPTEQDLLAAMHEKTRYNIRLAQKKGVEILIGAELFEQAWELFEATAKRDGFRLHAKRYYQKMIQCGVAFLAVAKHENDVLAANIMIDFDKTRTYLHGASSNTKRNFMAPYVLHWELMKQAKANGIIEYDWWGVAPLHAPEDHAWAGISRFKRGFGGDEVTTMGTYDVVIHPLIYRLYQLIRTWRT